MGNRKGQETQNDGVTGCHSKNWPYFSARLYLGQRETNEGRRLIEYTGESRSSVLRERLTRRTHI